ncbi:MAG: hypothetical protein KDB18_12065, partial [Salinibacterium sp.]|nr:hypothetical protein [Salinibacterium sp.]
WNMAGLRHDDLPALAGLERVEDLAFTGNAWLNDADLEVICRMKGLRRLLVGGNGFQSAEFGARGMRALARHPSLRAVGLDQVRLTSSDVEPLFTKGNWEEIGFNSVTGLNDQMIDNLAGRNPGLRRLTIQDCPSFDGSGLRAFDSSQLEVLDISGGGLADQNLIDFARANRHCRITTWRGKPWALEHARLLIHDPTFKAVEDAVVVIVDQADGRVVGQAELRSYLMERRALYVGPTTNPMVPRILVYDTCVLAPGNYRALIHAPGFHAEELDFSIMEGERQELSLALRPGSALDGNRRRAWSTEPARFEVVAELASMNGIDPTQVQFTLTDDSDDPVMRSTFEVTDQRGTQGNVFTVPAGIWRVHAFAVGATPMQTTVQVVPGSTAQAHLGTNR